MKQASNDLSPRETEQLAEQLVARLAPAAKLRLAQRLDRELVRRGKRQVWPTRFRKLLARIDRRARQHPRLLRRALKAVGPARRAFYARRARHQRPA